MALFCLSGRTRGRRSGQHPTGGQTNSNSSFISSYNSPYTSKETNPKTHDYRAIMGDMGSSYALPESHRDVSFTMLGPSEDSLTALPDHAQLFDRDRSRDQWHHGSSIASTWLAQLAHCCYLETRNPTATGINRPHRLGKFHLQSCLRCIGLAHVK